MDFVKIEPDNEVFIIYWWGFISTVSFLNLCYLFSKITSPYKKTKSEATAIYDQWMRCLSVPYVFMTSWRSFFPCIYSTKVVLFDYWMSSTFTGRFLATIGEVCFVNQICMGVRRANHEFI